MANYRSLTYTEALQLLGDQTKTVDATCQGNLLKVKVMPNWDIAPPTKPRGAIKGFSAAARRRMLQTIGRIAWEKIPHNVFITLTLPDSHVNHGYAERTMYRWMFTRLVERLLERPVATLWRTEWKVRQSGQHEGKIAPHLHMLAFGVRYIAKEWVNETWGLCIDHHGPLHTRIDACDGPGGAFYCTKYAAKEECMGGLANDAYLNKRLGRGWGMTRRKLVPLAPLQEVVGLTQPGIDAAMVIAGDVLGKHYLGSYFLLGDSSQEYFNKIRELGTTPDEQT